MTRYCSSCSGFCRFIRHNRSFLQLPLHSIDRDTTDMTSNNTGIGKIAIVGGGISGVVLGLALIKRGIDVTIYEQAHHFGEIGAGVAFNPAATRAMEICSPDVYKAFEEVATRNISPEKKQVWFDWLDGQNDKVVGQEEHLFTISNDFGANAVHRYVYFLVDSCSYPPIDRVSNNVQSALLRRSCQVRPRRPYTLCKAPRYHRRAIRWSIEVEFS